MVHAALHETLLANGRGMPEERNSRHRTVTGQTASTSSGMGSDKYELLPSCCQIERDHDAYHVTTLKNTEGPKERTSEIKQTLIGSHDAVA